MRCGLEECEEATENRFLRGLNTKIQDMLLHKTYNSLTCLVKLTSKIEIQLALSEETIAKPSPTCENKNCIDEMSFIVCSAMSNLGQNKTDLAAHLICDRTTSKMRGLSPKIILGDSRRIENAQTHTNKHTIPNMKFKLKLLQVKCHVLGFTKDKAQDVLQKIIRVCGSIRLSR
jgi:hypothetical protein